jgi:hypothetical protein
MPKLTIVASDYEVKKESILAIIIQKSIDTQDLKMKIFDISTHDPNNLTLDELKSEIWHPIDQFPNHFISNYGRLHNRKTNNFLKSKMNENGAYWVEAISNTKKKTFRLDKLVLSMFDPTKENINKLYVIHKDSDDKNNRLDNLKWSFERNDPRYKYKLIDFPNEVWVKLYGFSYYEISNYSRIRNRRHRLIQHKLFDGRYYVQITLKKDDIITAKGLDVGKGVLSSFHVIDNTHDMNDIVTIYKDGDIRNNHLENLGYMQRNKFRIKNCNGNKNIIKIRNIDYSNEIWKYIEGSNNHFISNFGRVRKGNKFRKLCANGGDYVFVNIYINKKRKCLLVHRLVASIFKPIENWNNMIVNHIDGDKCNNYIDNLEFVTHSENTQHAHDTGLIKCFKKAVYQIDSYTNEIIGEYESIKEASEVVGLFTASGITAVINGRQITAGGYKWEFKDEIKAPAIIADERWVHIHVNDKLTEYKISDYGRLWRNNRILKPSLCKGYYSFQLSIENQKTRCSIHRSVAKYFIENINNLPIVHHKDENKTNNHYTNLQYVTASENVKASYGNGNNELQNIRLGL